MRPEDEHSPRKLNGGLLTVLRAILTTVITAAIIGLGTWTLTIAEKLSRMEAYLDSNNVRIGGLEIGRTTPMAAETRAEFNNLRRELEDVRSRMRLVHESHNAFMERLIDTVKERKP